MIMMMADTSVTSSGIMRKLISLMMTMISSDAIVREIINLGVKPKE